MSSSVKATAAPTARAAAAPRARGRMPVEKELRKVRQKQVQRLNAVAKAVGIKAISDGAAKPLVQALVDGENKNTAKKTCWRENFRKSDRRRTGGGSLLCSEKQTASTGRRDFNRDATPQNAATLPEKLFQKGGSGEKLY